MSKDRSTKTVKVMTPGLRVLVLGSGHIGHIVKMNYFLKILISIVWNRVGYLGI